MFGSFSRSGKLGAWMNYKLTIKRQDGNMEKNLSLTKKLNFR